MPKDILNLQDFINIQRALETIRALQNQSAELSKHPVFLIQPNKAVVADLIEKVENEINKH